MNILAIDTTTKKAHVTVKKDILIIDKSIDNEITHSEKLLPLIDVCLNEAMINIDDIDTYCITTGPGSFTGIRIGMATIKAFAKIKNAQIFAVNNLELMAYKTINNIKEGEYILTLLNAKNNRVYYSLYKLEDNVLKLVISPANDILSDAINKTKIYINNLNLNINITLTISLDTIDLFENELNNHFSNTNIDINLFNTEISSSTLISTFEEYTKKKLNDISKYMFNYSSLDATYIRPSGAERIKNGEKI